MGGALEGAVLWWCALVREIENLEAKLDSKLEALMEVLAELRQEVKSLKAEGQASIPPPRGQRPGSSLSRNEWTEADYFVSRNDGGEEEEDATAMSDDSTDPA